MYDGLLKVLDPIKDLDAIAFADDLVLVIIIRKSQDIGDRVREAMKLVTNWCNDTNLYYTYREASPEDFEDRRGWWGDHHQKHGKIFGGAFGQCQEVFPPPGASV